MTRGKWTDIADGLEFRNSSGRPVLKVTRTDGDGSLYNLLEYQKDIGYVWQDRYIKSALNRWLANNGYPRIP